MSSNSVPAGTAPAEFDTFTKKLSDTVNGATQIGLKLCDPSPVATTLPPLGTVTVSDQSPLAVYSIFLFPILPTWLHVISMVSLIEKISAESGVVRLNWPLMTYSEPGV